MLARMSEEVHANRLAKFVDFVKFRCVFDLKQHDKHGAANTTDLVAFSKVWSKRVQQGYWRIRQTVLSACQRLPIFSRVFTNTDVVGALGAEGMPVDKTAATVASILSALLGLQLVEAFV